MWRTFPLDPLQIFIVRHSRVIKPLLWTARTLLAPDFKDRIIIVDSGFLLLLDFLPLLVLSVGVLSLSGSGNFNVFNGTQKLEYRKIIEYVGAPYILP